MTSAIADGDVGVTAGLPQLVMQLGSKLQQCWEEAAQEYGITGAQAGILMHLGEPIPMNQLAIEMTCQPSNLTAMIDRLEEAGFVRREPGMVDRRVKNLVLTREGQSTRSELADVIANNRLFTDALSAAEIDQLTELLSKIIDSAE